MAVPAVDHRRINRQMGFPEGSALKIVALSAERLNRLVHQVRLAGKMGLVAFLAISPRGGMNLLFCDLSFQVLMAGQTEIRAGAQEKASQFRLVRAVAFRAFSGDDRSVFTLGFLHPIPDVRVTGCTEGTLLLRCHPFVVAPMGIMAGEAHPFGERVMVGPARLFFHQVPVTLSAHFRPG